MQPYYQTSRNELAYLLTFCASQGGYDSSEALGLHHVRHEELVQGLEGMRQRGALTQRGGRWVPVGRDAAMVGTLDSVEQWIQVRLEDGGARAHVLFARGRWGQQLIIPGENFYFSQPKEGENLVSQISALISQGLNGRAGAKVSVKQRSLSGIGQVTVHGSSDGPWRIHPVITSATVPREALSKADVRAWLSQWLTLSDDGRAEALPAELTA